MTLVGLVQYGKSLNRGRSCRLPGRGGAGGAGLLLYRRGAGLRGITTPTGLCRVWVTITS